MNGKKKIVIHEEMDVSEIMLSYLRAGYTHDEIAQDIDRQLGHVWERVQRETAERIKKLEQLEQEKNS
ncbi:hypothetical protein [Bacillus sp. AK031]